MDHQQNNKYLKFLCYNLSKKGEVMKKAFTLIELIFVIVIIGILAAVAVPKFLNLKQNAQASNVIKQTVDAAQMAVETVTNYRDLEGYEFNGSRDGIDTTNKQFALDGIVKLHGKGWSYIKVNDNLDKYEYNDTQGNTNQKVVEFNMSSTDVNYSIRCDKFIDTKTQDKCAKLLGDKNYTFVHLTW